MRSRDVVGSQVGVDMGSLAWDSATRTWGVDVYHTSLQVKLVEQPAAKAGVENWNQVFCT